MNSDHSNQKPSLRPVAPKFRLREQGGSAWGEGGSIITLGDRFPLARKSKIEVQKSKIPEVSKAFQEFSRVSKG